MLAPILRSLAHGVLSGKAWSIVAPLLGPLAPQPVHAAPVCGDATLELLVAGEASLDGSFTPDQGLAAWYKLDGDLTDSSGRGHDLAGPATFGPGVFNQSMVSGAGTRNVLVSMTDLQGTIACWFQGKDNQGNIQGGAEIDFTGSPDPSIGLHVFSFGTARDSICVFLNGVIIIQVDDVLAVDQWLHAAVTCKPRAITLYIDGVEAGFVVGDVPPGWSTQHLSIGVGDTMNPIDEVRISNVALSADDIALLYRGGGPVQGTAALEPIVAGEAGVEEC